MLIIKDSDLCPVTKLKLIQDRTEIISYGSLAEKKLCCDFFITVSVSYQTDDIKLPFTDIL